MNERPRLMHDRCRFIASSAAVAIALGAVPSPAPRAQRSLYSISLAQWSVNRRIFGGELDPLDFPAFTKRTFDIDAVEYVNRFFIDKAEDRAFLSELQKRCDDTVSRAS